MCSSIRLVYMGAYSGLGTAQLPRLKAIILFLHLKPLKGPWAVDFLCTPKNHLTDLLFLSNSGKSFLCCSPPSFKSFPNQFQFSPTKQSLSLSLRLCSLIDIYSTAIGTVLHPSCSLSIALVLLGLFVYLSLSNLNSWGMFLVMATRLILDCDLWHA